MSIEINFGQTCYPIQSILIYLIMYVYHSLHVIGTWKFVPLEKTKKEHLAIFWQLLLFPTNRVFNIMKIKDFLLEGSSPNLHFVDQCL